MTAARRGDWRAAAFLYARVHGNPRETVVQETEEPEIIRDLRALTPEQRRDLLRQWNEEKAAEAAI